MNYIETAFRSFICKNFINTEFLLTLATEKFPQYRLFLAIICYERNDYRRSLHLLSDLHTLTSLYYQALCYQKLDKEERRIALLERIIAGECEDDVLSGSSFDILLVKKSDMIFFYSQLAEAHIQNSDVQHAMPYVNRAYRIFPLYSALKVLVDEGEKPAAKSSLKEMGRNYASENSKNTPQSDDEIQSDELMLYLREFMHDYWTFYAGLDKALIEKYKTRIPGSGSYFLSFAGKILINMGRVRVGGSIFEILRTSDPAFLENLDVYSTALWQMKSKSPLAALARDAVGINRFSYVSWSIMGNYFSSVGDHTRAILCFKRSILISRNAYAYALLGHESILRSDYKMAADCFRSSIKMHAKNFNAYFGLGIVESKVGDFSVANKYLSKAMNINPHNKMLRLIYLQILNKNRKTQEAIKFLAEIFNFQSTEINPPFIEKVVLELKKSKEEIDEFILLEFVELLIVIGMLDEATMVLSSMSGRSRLYYSKKSLLDDKMAQRDLGNEFDDSINELY